MKELVDRQSLIEAKIGDGNSELHHFGDYGR
jgi:hypothetical protein